ncbi:alpha/beta hydrolase [Riemerella anatipestifer]|uniref:alpha/beta hydrolase n=1 Tax=Riemerella anatipestifer TaxID=34085 RepID=UPI00129E5889|nr:alpha/beta fold hydrolase [Riemerella anatipestifer]MRM82782.1 alpha/beta fold hydrolase [Riemerella anatipestifer]
MKTKFLLLILLVAKIIFVNAQMEDKFYFPRKDLRANEWTKTSELNIVVDKDTINTVLLKTEQSPKATIFLFHGAGGNISYYYPIALKFVKANFQVVMVDFRGYGKSTGTPTHKNIVEDAKVVFEKYLKMKEVKKIPILVYGLSIGTQIATHITKENSKKITGLILEGGMSSFGDIAGAYAPQYKDFLERSFVNVYSSKEDIKNINKVSVLVIHSTEDKEVPFEQAKVVFNNANEPKEFMEIKGEHMQGMKLEGQNIIGKLNKMLNKNQK